MDVALVSDEWIGAHAVWDPERLRRGRRRARRSHRARPGRRGGHGAPPGGSAPGVHLRFGRPGRPLLAALGPGRLTPLCVREVRPVAVGAPVTMRGPGTLALDGEREMVLRAGETAEVRLAADGPRVLDVAAVLRAHAARSDGPTPHDVSTDHLGGT